MDSTWFDRQIGGMTWKQWLALVVIGLAAWKLIVAQPVGLHPAAPSVVRREREYLLGFQAHQLFDRGLEQLSDAELNDVKRWRRCLELMTVQPTSHDSLSAEECRFVVETLPEFFPDLKEYAGYRKIYESCANRLMGQTPPALVAVAGSSWEGQPPHWE